MTAVHNAAQEYVLGNSPHEQERLKMQARILERWTEHFFRLAGLEQGMQVLDLGCGMGDVSLLAARLIGPSGHVTGIDRDQVVIERARERIRAEGHDQQIELIHADFLEFQAASSFDAVVGRYVLVHQPDPVAAIRHAARQVRPDGIIVFHEVDDTNGLRSYPDGTLFEKIYALVRETFRRSGCRLDLGLQLTGLFLEAGLPRPTVKVEVPVGGEPGSFIYRWITETLLSILPRAEQFGLAKATDLDVDSLVARMEADARAHHAQIVGPVQFCAWAKKRDEAKVGFERAPNG
jgi:ubiquinone/menaquinone biosynthesis C-methylase UbiE